MPSLAIRSRSWQFCPECHQSGAHACGCPNADPPPEYVECPDCEGHGEQERTIYYAGGEAPMDVPVICNTCYGSGGVPA